MRLGFFGGTFNPVHLGHLALADAAMKALQLDHLYWLPANPWQKNAADLMPKEKRLALLRLAITDRQSMSVDTRELDRKTVSYSIDTVRELAALYPKDKRFYLIGADQWTNFHTWKDWKDIFNYMALVVFTRNNRCGHCSDEVSAYIKEQKIKVLHLPMPALDIESSRIRLLLNGNRCHQTDLKLATLVPESVLEYLKKERTKD